MARGLPAVWSALLGMPLIGLGVDWYVLAVYNTSFVLDQFNIYMLVPLSELEPLGLPLLGFGVFVVGVGLYVQSAAPSPPRLRDDEHIVETRRPSQRVAVTNISLSLPLLGAAVYLLFFTIYPYVYPTIAFVVGLYFFSTGLKTYWANTLTSYYVTTRRVVSSYRFLSLRRQEIPLRMIRGVEERKSIIESMVGLGNIQIASGGGGGSVKIVIRNIADSTGFADELRDLME